MIKKTYDGVTGNAQYVIELEDLKQALDSDLKKKEIVLTYDQIVDLYFEFKEIKCYG